MIEIPKAGVIDGQSVVFVSDVFDILHSWIRAHEEIRQTAERLDGAIVKIAESIMPGFDYDAHVLKWMKSNTEKSLGESIADEIIKSTISTRGA